MGEGRGLVFATKVGDGGGGLVFANKVDDGGGVWYLRLKWTMGRGFDEKRRPHIQTIIL